MEINSLYNLLEFAAKKYANADALVRLDGNNKAAMSFSDMEDKTCLIARGLMSLGVKKSSSVCLLGNTSLEATLADFAIAACGAIAVSIHAGLFDSEINSIIANSEASLIFIDASEIDATRILKDNLKLKNIILINTEKPVLASNRQSVYSLDQLIKLGESIGISTFRTRLLSINPKDMAGLIYTSGTTGKAKGVILTHQNILNKAFAVLSNLPDIKGLKTAHITSTFYIDGKVLQFLFVYSGAVQYYLGDLYNDIKSLEPDFLFTNPHLPIWLYKKLIFTRESNYSLIQRLLTAILNKIIPNVLTFINKLYEKRSAKASTPSMTYSPSIRERLIKYIFLKRLHKFLGTRLSFIFVSGAGLLDSFTWLFPFIGVKLYEGYSLSEFASFIYINTFSNNLKEGRAIKGSFISLGLDNEIKVKSDSYMVAYYKDESRSRLLLDKGWFNTGDIGHIDGNGVLKVIERRDDLITMDKGFIVSPLYLEAIVSLGSMYIKNIFVYGNSKSFLSALIVLDRDIMYKAIPLNSICETFEQYIQDPVVIKFIKSDIDRINKDLKPYENIKKIAILDKDFLSNIKGVYTPTMKLRRAFVLSKYKKLFDQFYAERYN